MVYVSDRLLRGSKDDVVGMGEEEEDEDEDVWNEEEACL